ncbi:E3 ubiquitin-protein ligase TRIM39-like [Onychostoma macrolepis]|uniref:Bloodthirsty n=1 Tax=Onychostoma macrolepis TaxID=369639 RepID=A0A7J6BRL0_9TELE|nr:E3 ubiquitin-protein ligase TRIM39-like [Onychostoma macrolepis]XP_058619314.1 E3 ubiquitin-protein ligase TRIM39-like [Onychostoma macrolepis]KAF4096272.1 hypothetical protein G5714_022241 [Onychostoma macrolepis]
MASSSDPLNEELQCSICLDVFTDPVTTPCGHSFCKTCLNEHWTDTQTFFCPSCNETFSKRPDLKVNTTLTNVVQYFKKLNPGRPEVFCDICDERKQKAVKSCLTCQSSYCETHLEPHHRVQRLKKHKLINAVENLEDYICQKHQRPLDLFCRDDQTSVCLSCTEGDHRTHNTVPIEEESQEKKKQLVQTQTQTQQMIQNIMKKIQEIQHSVDIRKTLTSIDLFLTSSQTVHIANWMIIGLGFLLVAILFIFPKQFTMSTDPQSFSDDSRITQAEDLIKDLQQEFTKLKKRKAETQLHLSQMYSSNEKLHQTGLKWAQMFAVDVRLDPDTADRYLILSDDGKQVRDGDIEQAVKENPRRFNVLSSVLAKQGFSSGRFYYEVQVKGKTEWSLGVARESIYRKGIIRPTPVNGFWILILRNPNQYIAGENPPISFSLEVKPEKVGVFVDYEEGLVSFYDVGSSSYIYSFTGQTFTEKLYPYFNPGLNDIGKNKNPLIITPVNK